MTKYFLVRYKVEVDNYGGEEFLKTFDSETQAQRFVVELMSSPSNKVNDILSLSFRYHVPEITRYELAIKNGGFALQIIPEKTPQK